MSKQFDDFGRRRKGRRRRKGLAGLVSIPGLGLINYTVNSTDILIGTLIGLVGGGAVNMALKKLLPGKVPDFFANFMPFTGSLAAGLVAFFLQRNRNLSRARAHLVGAVAAGAAVNVWDQVTARFPDMRGVSYGLLLNDPRVRRFGVLVNDPRRAMASYASAGHSGNGSNLAELAALSMDEDAYADVAQLMAMP